MDDATFNPQLFGGKDVLAEATPGRRLARPPDAIAAAVRLLAPGATGDQHRIDQQYVDADQGKPTQ